MTDVETLCHEARRSLAEARGATLLVAGFGRIPTGPAPVLLLERDGSPTFLCEPDSPVRAAASVHSPAVLSVPGHPGSAAIASVTFVGTLAAVGVETVGDARVDVVELMLSSVLVEPAAVGDPGAAQQQLPLARYSSRTVTLSAAAEAMRVHTNACHEPQLRAVVAALSDQSPDAIAAAEIAGLDPRGAELAWIDEHGLQRSRLSFASTARDPRELGALLRAGLGRSHRVGGEA